MGLVCHLLAGESHGSLLTYCPQFCGNQTHRWSYFYCNMRFLITVKKYGHQYCSKPKFICGSVLTHVVSVMV